MKVSFSLFLCLMVPSLQALNVNHAKNCENVTLKKSVQSSNRRAMLSSLAFVTALTCKNSVTIANAEDYDMYNPKFVQEYPDFVRSEKGWSYKDVTVGSGNEPKTGDRVVYEWSGYTIGYFGRPFEAKGGPKGGAFDKDLDYDRDILGSNAIIPALEDAFRGMKPGGVRQVIVPYGPLSYPSGDKEHTQVGPKPSTFSGQRALNFVLDNPRVDRTLLFNLKLVRVDTRNTDGSGFVRGNK